VQLLNYSLTKKNKKKTTLGVDRECKSTPGIMQTAAVTGRTH